jgi:hypothetical protein
MAESQETRSREDLATVYRSLFVDLPLASARWGLGMGEEKEVAEAAWAGYDAAVRLSTTAVDNLYRTPVFGDFTSRSLDGLLRWQRFGNAFAGVLFAGLWQTVGLPTAAETHALREEIQALREEVRALRPGLLVKSKESGVLQREEPRAVAQVKLRANGIAKPLRSAA